MAALKYRGVEIELDGVTYVCPKLSFKAFEDNKARLKAISEGSISDPVELQNAFADVIHAALRRNYPDLPRETVLDALDWDNATEHFQTVLRQSVPAAPPGEPAAGSPSGSSTGMQPSPT